MNDVQNNSHDPNPQKRKVRYFYALWIVGTAVLLVTLSFGFRNSFYDNGIMVMWVLSFPLSTALMGIFLMFLFRKTHKIYGLWIVYTSLLLFLCFLGGYPLILFLVLAGFPLIVARMIRIKRRHNE